MSAEANSDNECESLPQEPLIFDDMPGIKRATTQSPCFDETISIFPGPSFRKGAIHLLSTPRGVHDRFTTPQGIPDVSSSVRPVDGSPAFRYLDTESGWSDVGRKTKSLMTRNSAMYETPYESVVPEQCQITWIIRDFSSFRHASRNAPIPPLKSPDISSKGLRALLHPYWKKGDIVAEVVLPECCSIATTYCFKFSVISPLDAKLIISREVSSTVKRGKTPPRTVVRLWHKSISRRTSYQKLLTNNQLTLVIQAEVYDHSATPFVGIPATEIGSEDGDACLLQDIREFCESTPAQTIQVVCGPTIYTGCRFLLQARSQKMRILLADREKNWQRLVIGDLEPAIVGQIMNFVHTNSCEYLAEESTDDGDLLRLLLACNNYHIPSLAEKICQKLMCRLQMHNVLRYWEVAKSCDLCAALTQACCRYLDGLPGSRVADMMKKHVSDVSVP